MYQTLIDNNLNIFFGGQYKDMPVQIHTEWLIEEYLEATYRTIFNALAEYPSTCIVRVDLKIPKHYRSNSDNVILNFISSLQGQIDADLKHRATVGEPVQSCKIRYVAARDRDKFLTVQYHLLLFFNLKTYNCIGKREVNIGGNMGERLRIAWSEALANDLDYVKQANLVSVLRILFIIFIWLRVIHSLIGVILKKYFTGSVILLQQWVKSSAEATVPLFTVETNITYIRGKRPSFDRWAFSMLS